MSKLVLYIFLLLLWQLLGSLYFYWMEKYHSVAKWGVFTELPVVKSCGHFAHELHTVTNRKQKPNCHEAQAGSTIDELSLHCRADNQFEKGEIVQHFVIEGLFLLHNAECGDNDYNLQAAIQEERRYYRINNSSTPHLNKCGKALNLGVLPWYYTMIVEDEQVLAWYRLGA